MIYISYRGIYDGNNYQDANTPSQINKATSRGYTCMIDVWRENDRLYLGNDEPVTEVTAQYIQGNKYYINARNTAMQTWITAQPSKLYPNYFWFDSPTPPPAYTTASNGKLITPGTVPVNNTSIIYLPEIDDAGLFSTVKLKCYGIISSYLTFIRRMRFEGIWY